MSLGSTTIGGDVQKQSTFPPSSDSIIVDINGNTIPNYKEGDTKIRPRILVDFGRVNTLKVSQKEIINKKYVTYLTDYFNANALPGTFTLPVRNSNNFKIYDKFLVGEFGSNNSMIVEYNGTDFSLVSDYASNQDQQTPLYKINYDTVEVFHSESIGGNKLMIATVPIDPQVQYLTLDELYNNFNSGYFSARFTLTINGSTFYSPFSEEVAVSGYDIQMAGSIIKAALHEVGRDDFDTTITEDYAYQQLNLLVNNVIESRKRWSWQQKFDTKIGMLEPGMFRIPIPKDLDDVNTPKSIYNLRIGKGQNLIWIDKEEWNNYTLYANYSYLTKTLNPGDTQIWLESTGSFNESSGSLNVRDIQIPYSANDTINNVLTIDTSTGFSVTNVYPRGSEAYAGMQVGIPQWWTIFNGFIYIYPVISNQVVSGDILMDYYSKQYLIKSDTDKIPFTNVEVAINFLIYKFQDKINSGKEDTTGTLSTARDNYTNALNIMELRENPNKKLRLRPNYKNFGEMSKSDYIKYGDMSDSGDSYGDL